MLACGVIFNKSKAHILFFNVHVVIERNVNCILGF